MQILITEMSFKIGNTTFLLEREPSGAMNIYRSAEHEDLSLCLPASEVREFVSNLVTFTGHVAEPSEHTKIASEAWIVECEQAMYRHGGGWDHKADIIRWLLEMEATYPDFHLSNIEPHDLARLLWNVKSVPRFSDDDPDGSQGMAWLTDEFFEVFGEDWAGDCLEVALENIPFTPQIS